MAEDCIFISVLGKCPLKQQLSHSRPDGARLHNIIDDNIWYGGSLCIDIQEKLDFDQNLQVYYQRNCISKYLGKKRQEEFEAAWPDGFYKPLKRVVVPMTTNNKSINVGGQRVVDTGVPC